MKRLAALLVLAASSGGCSESSVMTLAYFPIKASAVAAPSIDTSGKPGFDSLATFSVGVPISYAQDGVFGSAGHSRVALLFTPLALGGGYLGKEQIGFLHYAPGLLFSFHPKSQDSADYPLTIQAGAFFSGRFFWPPGSEVTRLVGAGSSLGLLWRLNSILLGPRLAIEYLHGPDPTPHRGIISLGVEIAFSTE